MLAAVLAAAAASGLSSIPHCAGMCGPLAACASGRGAWRYHIARSISYAVLGAAAGTAGSELAGVLDVRWGNALVSGRWRSRWGSAPTASGAGARPAARPCAWASRLAGRASPIAP